MRPAAVEGLEDEAGIIFEVAGEPCRESEIGDIESARGHETETRVETVQRRV